MDASIAEARAEAVRREFARQGVSISSWARAHGYSSQLVYQVLAGRKRCVRGQCHQIAVRLGLKDGVLGTVADIDVPKDRSDASMASGIPITYVPARNTIFLSVALGWAEVLGAYDIFLGVNAVDYSGYPDCRPEFLEAFEEVARRGTRAGIEGHGVEIRAPLVHLTKAGIIRLGRDLGVDYSLTRTCYDPSPEGAACGHCDACLLRLKGFAELGLTDPAPYRQTVAS